MNEETPSPRLDSALTLRLYKTLTATAEELFQIMQDPSSEILRTALKNPRLGEDHLLVLLKRRDIPEDLLKSLHQFESKHSSHRLKLALAKNPGTPGPLLSGLLPHLHLFELLDLCLFPGVTPDQRYAAERQIIQRLPGTPLGNKLVLARRGTASLVGELLRDAEPRLLECCLTNPRLKEISILQFLGGPTANAETISMIARHPRWQNRPNLRLAILKNRKTPSIWFTLFLPRLTASDLSALLSSRRLEPNQKKLVEEERTKRKRG